MPAHFYPISRREMDEFLTKQGFLLLDPTTTPDLAKYNVREAVYGKRVPHKDFPLTLRVFTGIVGDESREVGEDAIRVTLFMRAKDGQVVKVAGDKRVHRVEGWRDNLQNRLDNWQGELRSETCYKCGSPMVKRKGKNGKPDFLGCATWFLHQSNTAQARKDDAQQKPANLRQDARQGSQKAPGSTKIDGKGLRVVERAEALEIITGYLNEPGRSLDEIARIFSTGCDQNVVVKDGGRFSDPHHNGKRGDWRGVDSGDGEAHFIESQQV